MEIRKEARELTPPHAVRHYTVKEIPKIWNLSADTIAKIFENEPGVIVISERRAARERLLDRLVEMDASLFARAILHPRLKMPIRLVDHLYFVAEHDDHHLARIWELV